MKLSELIHSVWEDKRVKELGMRKNEVKTIISVFIELLGKSLLSSGKVKIQGLFTLDLRKIKGRKIRNLQTKEYMYSKDYYKVGLTPSDKIKKELKKLDK